MCNQVKINKIYSRIIRAFESQNFYVGNNILRPRHLTFNLSSYDGRRFCNFRTKICKFK